MMIREQMKLIDKLLRDKSLPGNFFHRTSEHSSEQFGSKNVWRIHKNSGAKPLVYFGIIVAIREYFWNHIGGHFKKRNFIFVGFRN
jgi:hypothetical protein